MPLIPIFQIPDIRLEIGIAPELVLQTSPMVRLEACRSQR